MAYTVKATSRIEVGKGPIRRMRRGGAVPAVMYGHGDPSVMLALNAREFDRLVDEISGHSPIVELDIDGRQERCIIKTLQRNPIDGSLLHVDFQKVHPDEKITMNVPVILKGSAEGVKAGGMLDHLMRDIPVRAPIDKIPEHFEIDVTPLGLGQSVHVGELKAEGVDFVVAPETAVVTVLVPRKLAAAQMEAEAAAAAAPAEGAEAAEEGKEPEVLKQKADKEEKEEEGKKPGAAEKKGKPEKKEKK